MRTGIVSNQRFALQLKVRAVRVHEERAGTVPTERSVQTRRGRRAYTAPSCEDEEEGGLRAGSGSSPYNELLLGGLKSPYRTCDPALRAADGCEVVNWTGFNASCSVAVLFWLSASVCRFHGWHDCGSLWRRLNKVSRALSAGVFKASAVEAQLTRMSWKDGRR